MNPSAPTQFEASANAWPLVRVRDVAMSFSGGTPPKADQMNWVGTIPWLSPKDMKSTHLGDTSDHVSEYAAQQYSRLMPAGTVFVVVRGMILIREIPIALSTAPMAFNQDIKAFSCSEAVDPEYLLYALIAMSPTLSREIGTSAHGTRRIGTAALDNLLIPLPPLEQQRSIAEALSTARARIALEKRRLDLLQELKAAARVKIFGDLPADIAESPVWPFVPLRTLLREPLRNGHSAAAAPTQTGIPTLTLTAVTKQAFTSANVKQTVADSSRVKDLWLHDGDVFIERANTAEMVGLAALYRGPDDFAIFPDLLIRVRVDEGTLLPEVLTEWLLTPAMRRYFQRHASGAATSMPKIDQGVVEEALVPVPPRSKQSELRALFSVIDAQIAATTLRSIALAHLFESALRRCIERPSAMSTSSHA